jgi:hypothetical protein
MIPADPHPLTACLDPTARLYPVLGGSSAGSVGDQAERGAAMTSWSTSRVRRGGLVGLLFRRNHLPGLRNAQASTEGVSKRFLATLKFSTAMRAIHARLAQVLPAPTPLPDQSCCIGPSRKTTFSLAKSGALGSAYLHLSIHGLSRLLCGSVQRCLCSNFCDSRCTGNIDRTCGKCSRTALHS